MAQIMEFLLNLLLMRGKFLTSAAAEKVHEAIRKCMQFRRKLSMEYDKATQMIAPFENMMELINYNASEYTCEGSNYVVTSQVRCRLYEQFSKMREKDFKKLEDHAMMKNHKNPIAQTAAKTLESTKTVEVENKPINLQENQAHMPCPDKEKNKSKNQDYLMDNLHAILKSQEFLFKNIIKLINFLENDPNLQLNAKRLEKIKYKLAACTDVLSSTVTSSKFSDIINNIIEEEITRCRFRNGESKTSAEINLKMPKTEGLGAALDISCKINDVPKLKKQQEKNLKLKEDIDKKLKLTDLENQRKHEVLRRQVIDSEVKRQSSNFLKRIRSEPAMSYSPGLTERYQIILRRTEPEIEDTKKLIEVNEERFNQFENELWHSLTTLKYTELKDDYKNICKCAFYNKRQFMAVESALSKQLKKEEDLEKMQKVVTISDSVFQIMERKLLFENVKQQMKESIVIPKNQEIESAASKRSQKLEEENKFYEVKQKIEENLKLAKMQQKSESVSPTQKVVGNVVAEKKRSSQEMKAEETKKVSSNKKWIEEKQKAYKYYKKSLKSLPNLQEKIVTSKTKKNIEKPKFRSDQETNTIININNLRKYLDKVSQNASSVTETKDVTQASLKEGTSTKTVVQANENNKLNLSETKPKINEDIKPVEQRPIKKTVVEANENNKSILCELKPKINEDVKEAEKRPTKKTVLQANENNKLILSEPKSKISVNEDIKAVEIRSIIESEARIDPNKPEAVKNQEIEKTAYNETLKHTANILISITKEKRNENQLGEKKKQERTNDKATKSLDVTSEETSNKQNIQQPATAMEEQGRKNEEVTIVLKVASEKAPKSQNIQQSAAAKEDKKQSITIILTKKDELPANVKAETTKTVEVPEVNPNIIKLIEKTNRELAKSKESGIILTAPIIKPDFETEKTQNKTEDNVQPDSTKPSENIPVMHRKKKQIISGQKLFEKVKSNPMLRTIRPTIKPKERKGSSEPVLSKNEPVTSYQIIIDQESDGQPADEASVMLDNHPKPIETVDVEEQKLEITEDERLQANAHEKLVITPKVSETSGSAKMNLQKHKLETTKGKSTSLQAITNAHGKLVITPREVQPRRLEKMNVLKRKLEIIETRSTSLHAITNAHGKLIVTSKEYHQPRREAKRATTVSVLDLKSDADLIRVNKQAFDELEKTLHSVRFLVSGPVIMRTKSSPTQRKNFNDASKKPFTTQPSRIIKTRKEAMSKGDNAETTFIKSRHEIKANPCLDQKKKLKSKTFSKLSAQRIIPEKKSVQAAKSLEIKPLEKCPSNMRRTTKTAMKKQQVLTTVSKDKEKKKQQSETEGKAKKESKSIDKGTKVPNFKKKEKTTTPPKNISGGLYVRKIIK